jgi:lysophospholipase L1-like esterase
MLPILKRNFPSGAFLPKIGVAGALEQTQSCPGPARRSDMGKAGSLAILFAAISAWPLAIAHAQPPGAPPAGAAGIVDNPCPPPLQPPPELEALQKQGPRAVFESRSPAVMAFLKEEDRRRNLDRAGLCRYQAANDALEAQHAPPPTAVFIGDSITDFWPGLDGDFFSHNQFLGRGIGAQVSSQGLLRFQQDVIELRPKVVHILYGTNDIAGLGGPTTYEHIQNNLIAMVQMARVNHIAAVIGTILPISHLPNGMQDPALNPAIVKMNAWIRDFGRREHVAVADYYPALSDGAGGFRSDLNSDGVHPTLAGYRVMEPITRAAVQAALARRRADHERPQ